MNVLAHALNNPYIYSGAVVARICTVLASLIWGVLIVIFPDAMGSNPNYRQLLDICPNEDVWGGGVIVVALVMAWRIFAHKPPIALGIVGYGFLALLWTYLWWGLVMGSRLWPTGISSATVLMVLSLYAFVANPRRE